MQYGTRSFALRLKQSEQDNSIVMFDCNHPTGYTYKQLLQLSPNYAFLVGEL
jgi:hypothetical protein